MKCFLISVLLFVSCAKIPIQSIDLAESLKEEAERMHTLNIKLINKIFQDKKLLINEVIQNEYLPAYLENFKKKIPDGVDFKARFADLVQAAYPLINSTRDSLLNVVDNTRNSIVEKLNADYIVFSSAFSDLQNLLKSSVKVDSEKSALFKKIKDLTKGKIDADAIEKATDKFITAVGAVGDKAAALNDTINLITK